MPHEKEKALNTYILQLNIVEVVIKVFIIVENINNKVDEEISNPLSGVHIGSISVDIANDELNMSDNSISTDIYSGNISMNPINKTKKSQEVKRNLIITFSHKHLKISIINKLMIFLILCKNTMIYRLASLVINLLWD